MSAQTDQRLAALRREMRAHNTAARIIPTADPHLCEYPPAHWALREALSGFTGSAGTLVVTRTEALLWTDSRYWEQAERELAESGIKLMRLGAPETPSVREWLAKNLTAESTVAIDPSTISAAAYEKLACDLAQADITLAGDEVSFAAVWPERPAPPSSAVSGFAHAQAARGAKRKTVMASVHAQGADALFVTALDDIAWITNLRGGDVAHMPVFTAYLLVEDAGCTLYCDRCRFEKALLTELAADGIQVEPYEAAASHVAQRARGRRLSLDPGTTTEALFEELCAAQDVAVVRADNPVPAIKAVKTRAELEALRETMIKDGAALCELFAWIEEEFAAARPLTETSVAEKLAQLRREQPGFIEESFATISAAGPNAALPHYRPSAESPAIEPDTLLLIDSGGQYTGGTTDITRTVVLGRPTREMKRDFTAVLRGHIALASARFPAGVLGSQLDTLARGPLWEIDADYGHGTGHGVGFCLSVHEGPVSISPRASNPASRVVPGLVLSNEPGLYRSGRWGIRTENLVTPVAADPQADAMQPMLVFETLSLCPFDTRLIDTAMMTPYEIWWVNDYHRRVREALEDKLPPKARAWLKRAAETI